MTLIELEERPNKHNSPTLTGFKDPNDMKFPNSKDGLEVGQNACLKDKQGNEITVEVIKVLENDEYEGRAYSGLI